MNIKYIIDNDKYTIKKKSDDFNFILTNSFGDFFSLQSGLNVFNKNSKKLIEIIKKINTHNKQISEVLNYGYKILRIFDDGSTDEFFMAPKGGLIYNMNGFDDKISIELNLKKAIFTEVENIEFIETLVNDFILGIKTINSKIIKRGNVVDILPEQKSSVIIEYGFSKEEIFDKINLLEKHSSDLQMIQSEIFMDLINKTSFKKPISDSVRFAYNFSKYNLYGFLNRANESNIGIFTDFENNLSIFSYEELISLRGLIDSNDNDYVKNKIYCYLELIEEKLNLTNSKKYENELFNLDLLFLFVKRFEDFIFHLVEKNNLHKYFSSGELDLLQKKLSFIFGKVIELNWNEKSELITENKKCSLIHQVGLLEFSSFLNNFCELLQVESKMNLKKFETLLRSKIGSTFLKNNILYDDENNKDETTNTFLSYYLYPSLFTKDVWVNIFSRSLNILEDEDENIKNSKNGDSVFWINNLIIICLNDLHKENYEEFISKYILKSTNIILDSFTIGYATEFLSSDNQKINITGISTYIEMINKMFTLFK